MFDKLKKWWHDDGSIADDHHGPLRETNPGDWVVMPYRIAEACRISMSTVGSHPDLPDTVRLWIAEWLAHYNGSLTYYFQENYGPDIFPVLEKITNEVWALSEKHYDNNHHEVVEHSFQQWESELGGGGTSGRDTDSDSPPTG